MLTSLTIYSIIGLSNLIVAIMTFNLIYYAHFTSFNYLLSTSFNCLLSAHFNCLLSAHFNCLLSAHFNCLLSAHFNFRPFMNSKFYYELFIASFLYFGSIFVN